MAINFNEKRQNICKNPEKTNYITTGYSINYRSVLSSMQDLDSWDEDDHEEDSGSAQNYITGAC